MRQDGEGLAPSMEVRKSDVRGRMLPKEKSRKGRKGREKRKTEVTRERGRRRIKR